MSVHITWHGHSTFSLDVNGTYLLVDPFFDGNPVAKRKANAVAADYILLTHGHGDHVADALPIAQRTGAMVISNFEIVTWLGSKGHEKGHGQNIGGGFQHPFGHVKMTMAFHSSTLPDGSSGGDPGGFLLTVDGKKIYIAGDTALYSDMALVGRVGLDVAILPVGDNYTMGPDDSLLALEYLKPKVVIPCHYNTWPIIGIDVQNWAERVRRETACQPVVLEVEGSYSL